MRGKKRGGSGCCTAGVCPADPMGGTAAPIDANIRRVRTRTRALPVISVPCSAVVRQVRAEEVTGSRRESQETTVSRKPGANSFFSLGYSLALPVVAAWYR